MALILKKAAKYKRISTVLAEGEAHLRDPFTPPPQILIVTPFPFHFSQLSLSSLLPKELKESPMILPISPTKQPFPFPKLSPTKKEDTDLPVFL